MEVTIHNANCLDAMLMMDNNSIDAIVTDPPYGLSFMGRKWDYDIPGVEIWEQCLRVLKPGGHLLAFAGARTQHRMAVNIEDAGFEIRNIIAWIYGSGMAKGANVSKAIDKAAGAERKKVRHDWGPEGNKFMRGIGVSRPWKDIASLMGYHEADSAEPATDAAKQWDGWHSDLRPALEPITMARKPVVGSICANVLEYGTGALNIDGCRIPGEAQKTRTVMGKPNYIYGASNEAANPPSPLGRFPVNLLFDGSEEALSGLDQSQQRYFYCPKASIQDREEGLEGFELKTAGGLSGRADGSLGGAIVKRKNHHPTVKPTELMRYLCRLVTPPGGLILDPFMGSGSTGKAAVIEGFNFIGCELDPSYVEVARSRIEYVNLSE